MHWVLAAMPYFLASVACYQAHVAGAAYVIAAKAERRPLWAAVRTLAAIVLLIAAIQLATRIAYAR